MHRFPLQGAKAMARAGTPAVSAVAALGLLATGLSAGVVLGASKPANLKLASGARVAVVSLLDAEVTHFHASRRVQDSYLKTYSVNWPVNGMLMEALREHLTQLGLTAVAAGTPDSLSRARETCLLNATLAKGLPKPCAPLYAQLAAAEHADAVIVLGPGLNDSAHGGSTRHRELPDYLRGWCIVSGEGGPDEVPVLLDLTELLLIRVSGGTAELVAREWGGVQRQSWTGFKAPADLKAIPDPQLAQLQPLFAAMLKQQAGVLALHLEITR